ncbi:MAG: sigma-54-dependent transcriptional regulator [Alkalispirochaetaceae bacterium]
MTPRGDELRPVVCIADDEEGIRFGLSRLFVRAGYEVVTCPTGEEVLGYAGREHLDVLLLDVRLAGSMDGHEVLKEVRRIDPDLPVLIITGYGTIESAVEAMKEGAEDYIVKPVDNARLLNKVSSRLELGRGAGIEGAESELSMADARKRSIIGESVEMRKLLTLASRIKQEDITVLITGESGVGKELLARHVHDGSPRASGPFIGVNCAAFSETLLLSELFGHEKGAFTGAEGRKAGCFERANGGTLFLDEIGDMAADTQAKLLRVLETRQFERLGGTVSVHADVRIIAATNRNLEELVESGGFREDLYYRINVVRMHIPPLRERPEDLRMMITEFLRLFNEKYDRGVTEIPQETMDTLLSYRWPGNTRELKNVMSQSVLLSNSRRLDLFGLSPRRKQSGQPAAAASISEGVGDYHGTVAAVREDIGRQLVLSALRQSRGNKSEAARMLGITRKTLQRKITRFGIDSSVQGG